MCQLKEPLTYPEQLQRLKEVHNLAIKVEAAALQILENVNYYRLSAYGIGLKQRDDKEKYLISARFPFKILTPILGRERNMLFTIPLAMC